MTGFPDLHRKPKYTNAAIVNRRFCVLHQFMYVRSFHWWRVQVNDYYGNTQRYRCACPLGYLGAGCSIHEVHVAAHANGHDSCIMAKGVHNMTRTAHNKGGGKALTNVVPRKPNKRQLFRLKQLRIVIYTIVM